MEPGITSIDDLLKKGGGNRSNSDAIDSILEELNSSNNIQPSSQQPQHQIQLQQQQQQSGPTPEQIQNQQMHTQLMQQQAALENMARQNQEKDMILQNINQEKNKDEVASHSDLFNEFKPTLILFFIVSIFTLPVLNKTVCSSIGIEENTIFSFLKCFIICIIFFLLNKFI